MKIIAEMGINHNGSHLAALQLIDLAKEVGCDYIKAQLYDTDRLFPRDFPFYEDSKRAMLAPDEFAALYHYAAESGIQALASVFHEDLIPHTEALGMPLYKVASVSCPNTHLLKAIAATRKPVILSTGSHPDEIIELALDILAPCPVTLLYCVTRYPARFEDFDFDRAWAMEDKFGRPVGLSDHSPDQRAARAALHLGLPILEHHVTLSRTAYPNCDASSSWEPDDLRDFMKEVQRCESAPSNTTT